MSKIFRASNGLPVQFISSYAGEADYGVYLRRLDRDVRVRRNQATSEIVCRSTEATPDERAACVQAVAELMAHKKAEFTAWQAEQV